EKHIRLRRYVDITHGTRAKFTRTQATYVDLYCGPGRAHVKETGNIEDGSALIAADEAAQHVLFTQLHVGDIDAANVDACAKRLKARHVAGVCAHVGDAATTAQEVVRKLNPYG